MKNPKAILEEVWGYTSFRPLQEEIITSLLNGIDTVALLPTGAGKSLCYQIPALSKEGICIVVSPLIALINDQIEGLKNKGIKALSLSGTIGYTELQQRLDNAKYGNYKFLFLSPERLQLEWIQQAIKEMPVNYIAIDEAHCISQWGHDFRPAYTSVNILRTLHPLAPIIAVTATATPKVLKDTIALLQLEKPAIFKGSFERQNLAYNTVIANDKLYAIVQALSNTKYNHSAIVYVRSRNKTIEISSQLNKLGIKSNYYHGGIPSSEKETKLTKWKEFEFQVMVATNAFGMGIDHAAVRNVFHYQLPESLESYYQEAGRAGRDNKPASAILLFQKSDIDSAQNQFIKTLPTLDYAKLVYKKLNAYFQIPYGEGSYTTVPFHFSAFCAQYGLAPGKTFNTITALDRLGILRLTKQYGRRTTVQFITDSQTTLQFFDSNSLVSIIGKTILRMYAGIFEMPMGINVALIGKKTGQQPTVIIQVLKQLESNNIISLQINETDALLSFLTPREDDKTLNPKKRELEAYRTTKIKQVQAVIKYATNTTICNSVFLSSYFGDSASTRCGICNICSSQNNTVNSKDVTNVILTYLKNTDANSRELVEKTTFAEKEILLALDHLLEADKITITIKNKYTLKL